ncbi:MULTISPECIES: IS66 family insertion sequence element accessory protein TnpA [unclassified Serratia (in: enterobacteria)]|uniref:IS66 family insertion sequence element accessory protein TnpA n=1 Tax=unclassified Serratia (in: enterobacteria) TaxID=2647522 RepID=UPI003076109C
MAKQYSHSERQQHLDAWQQSGLSKKHYCRLHDLNPATFYYWLKHHRNDATVSVPAAFIPARRVMPENNDADTVTLNLPNGCSVRCLPAQLRAVMQALSLC